MTPRLEALRIDAFKGGAVRSLSAQGGVRRPLADGALASLDRHAPSDFSEVSWNEAFLRGVLSVPGAEIVKSPSTKHLEMGDLVIRTELRRLRHNLDARVVKVGVWTLDEQLRAAAESLDE